MPREIKFKAREVYNNAEWICGYFGIDHLGDGYIFLVKDLGEIIGKNLVQHKVIIDTVCEFTGFMDKFKKNIYTGDILKGDNSVIYEVFFNKGAFMAKVIGFFIGDESGDAEEQFPNPYYLGDFQLSSIAVIGNIHDKTNDNER